MGFNPKGATDGSYKDKDFSPPAAGWHTFYVTEAILGDSKKGQPMITVKTEVIASDDPDSVGKKVTEWFILIDEWFAKLSRFCMALDPDMVGAEEDPNNGFDPNDQDSINFHFVPQPFRGKISHSKGKDSEGNVRTDARFKEWAPLEAKHAEQLRELYGDELVPGFSDPYP